MIGGGALARRYAKALFGLGEEAGSAERMLAQVSDFLDTTTESEELSAVIFTPLHPREERRKVVRAVAEKLELGAHARAFAMLLVDENRMALLPEIRAALALMVDRAAGRLEAEVTSARPLDADAQARLRTALSRRVGAEVTLSTKVDPTLIGGVVARVGDLLFDGSLRTQLDSLAASLRKGSA